MDEMIAEFVTETTESLAMLDQELVKLEQNPQDKNILSNIFRVMHTIKGTCGFLGLHRLEKVAHAGENILGKFRDGELQVTPQAVTLILQSVDCIKTIVEQIGVSGTEPEGDDSALVDSVNRFADGDTGSVPAPVQGAAPAAGTASFFKGDDELEALIRAEEETKKKKGASTAVAVTEAPKPPATPEKKEVAVVAPRADAKESNAANQTIRVNLDVLEKMMQMVSELVLSRNQLLQLARAAANQQFLSPLQELSHITTELQENVMKTRMQPIGTAWSKFPRLVRDLSMELGKKIDLKMIGEDTELDRQLLEAIKDPLTHMVRNSCDHGIETPDVRKAAGKPESGTVTLNSYHDGGHIVIDISDDGKGLNVARIKEKAIAGGLATASEIANMSEKQILQFIFQPGFSTAEKVTAVSGRGVGMDVVRTNIEKIGGTIDLSSKAGEGSKISIKIPLTLAIVSVLIVEKGGERFAIPQINVRELIQVGERSLTKLERINNALVIRLREALLPVISLSDVLHIPNEKAKDQNHDFIVVCNVGGTDFGVMVDRIHNIEEIVVKPVSQAIKSIPLFSGNTILGDGSVIMILEPNSLAKSVGDIQLGSHQDHYAELQEEAMNSGKMTKFLLFLNDEGSPNAVPLELVWRLEEIKADTIEYVGKTPVVQYRGGIMRLFTLGEKFSLPKKDLIQVVVFSYDDTVIGLPVNRITDIVEVPFTLELEPQSSGYLGSMVITGHTTEIVDVAYLIDSVSERKKSKRRSKKVKKVLLVDDSPFFIKMTTPFLISAGYDVTTVENGIEGLAILEQSPKPFDVIVTDIQMPGMDGYDFAEACHSFPRSATIPIIGFTSTLDEEVMNKSKEAGMVKCISKNNRPELLKVIEGNVMKLETD